MNEKSLRLLEYDKVLAKVAAYTSFSAGEEAALASHPTTNLEDARLWQTQTAEAILLLSGDSDVTIGGAKDVRQSAERAGLGFLLSAENFHAIKNTLIAARSLKRTLLKEPEKRPELAAIADLIEEVPRLIDNITNTIDERGEVLDSASPELARIRQKMRIAYDRIQEKLRGLINSSNSQYLQEAIITMRGGRYVVPLRAEHKGRIKGVVHDQSGSGATLFVEPLNTVELNNSYRTIQIEEQKEIDRLLGELTKQVAEYAEEINRIVERIAEIDLIFARARFGMVSDAVAPIFIEWRTKPPTNVQQHPGSTVWIRGARHPLLPADEVVPTDFLVEDDLFTVLITGPNTGGKTVALKNIGLMVLMAQSGLHLPANEARLTVFDNIFADIGDEQSIEQSLSTFSAHITNIISILDQVDDRSLVILDELGSGTDPTEGAAIAQSIISFLRDKGATSFIATHYPELKLYASQTAGATNASMLFDLDTLSPTYELTIGIPGKSNALAIARRLGLNETVLDEAIGLVGVGSQEAESLIDSIFDLREKISAEEAATRLALKKAEDERDSMLLESAGIEYERRRILSETRKEAEQELENIRAEIRKARRTLRDAESLTQVKKISKRIGDLEEHIDTPIAASDLQVSDPKRRRNRRLKVGDNVLITALNQTGTIMEIQGKSAEVAVGRLTMKVRLDQLEFRGRDQPEKRETRLPRAPIVSDFPLELDIRGERVDTGLDRLDQYLDAASLSNNPFARIVHGKGTGRLRDAVRRALREHPSVAKWEEAKDSEGGTGVTIARFKA